MNTTIRIKADELNEHILEAIKKMFGQQEIDINISPVVREYDTLSDIESRIAKVNEKGGDYFFTLKEFEELSEKMLHDEPVNELLKKARQPK